MIDERTGGPDPLEAVAIDAPSSSQRRLIAVVGGLAVLAAAGLLVLTLGRGARPVSAGAELQAAAHGRGRAPR